MVIHSHSWSLVVTLYVVLGKILFHLNTWICFNVQLVFILFAKAGRLLSRALKSIKLSC